MQINNRVIFISVCVSLFNSYVLAQDLKPMAPPMDITGTKIEFSAQPIKNILPDKNQKQINDLTLQDKGSVIENKHPEPKNTYVLNDTSSADLNNNNQENKALEPSIPHDVDKGPAIVTDAEGTGAELQFLSDKENNDFALPTLNEGYKDNKDLALPVFSTENEDKNTQPQPTVESDNKELEQVASSETKQADAAEMELITEKIKQSATKHNTDIQNQADEVELELRLEEPNVLRDLRILWQVAVEKSTTIRLAIQKLSNPDEADKQNQGMVSKLLSPLASMAPLAAMASSSATQTAGALLGGGMLGSLTSSEDAQYNQAFLRVSDYDLIMLAKEVEILQAKLVVSYYEYKQAIERLESAEKALKNAFDYYQNYKNSDNFAASTAADAFYHEALQNQLDAKQKYLSARTSLEQISGNDAIIYIETLDKKEGQQTSPETKAAE